VCMHAGAPITAIVSATGLNCVDGVMVNSSIPMAEGLSKSTQVATPVCIILTIRRKYFGPDWQVALTWAPTDSDPGDFSFEITRLTRCARRPSAGRRFWVGANDRYGSMTIDWRWSCDVRYPPDRDRISALRASLPARLFFGASA